MMSIGQTRTATDVWFQADRMNTLADDWLAVPEAQQTVARMKPLAAECGACVAVAGDTFPYCATLHTGYLLGKNPENDGEWRVRA